ncbi:hypothetical protein, partial [Chromohalobacter japonicus]|uniref:hypothetical protein n=1 Tax=Chromohalobacter japonicus TaxID=223900 RepID=UPI0035E8E9EF
LILVRIFDSDCGRDSFVVGGTFEEGAQVVLSSGKFFQTFSEGSDFAPLNRLYSRVFLPQQIARNPPPTGFTRDNHAEAVPGRASVWPRYMVGSPGLLSAGGPCPAYPFPANGRLPGAWAYSLRYVKQAKGAGKP